MIKYKETFYEETTRHLTSKINKFCSEDKSVLKQIAFVST